MSESFDLVPVSVQSKIQGDISTIMFGVEEINIQDHPSYLNAVELTKAIKKIGAEVEANRDSLVRPRNTEVDAINAWFKEPKAKLKAFEDILKKAIGEYEAEVRRKQLEEQRRLDEEARKEREAIEAKARALREKEDAARKAEEDALARAEKARQDAEAADRRAAEAKNAEEAEAARAQKEAADKAAVQAQKEADKAASKAIAFRSSADLKEATAQSVVAVQAQAPKKAAGVVTSTTYSAKVVDAKAAILFCIKNDKFHLISLNEKIIDKLVKGEKEFFKMDGIEVIKETSIGIRK